MEIKSDMKFLEVLLVVAGGAKMNQNSSQHTIHGAEMNFTKQFRFSMDIRFILAPPATTSSTYRNFIFDFISTLVAS